jgi:hypothetical protein
MDGGAMRQRRKIKHSKWQPTNTTDQPATAKDEKLAPADEAINNSNLSLHELFEQQTRKVLERAELDEEQKQCILIAISCPCCGAGGTSYTVKLKSQK